MFYLLIGLIFRLVFVWPESMHGYCYPRTFSIHSKTLFLIYILPSHSQTSDDSPKTFCQYAWCQSVWYNSQRNDTTCIFQCKFFKRGFTEFHGSCKVFWGNLIKVNNAFHCSFLTLSTSAKHFVFKNMASGVGKTRWKYTFFVRNWVKRIA